MTIEHHTLAHDFPQQHALIQHLQAEDAGFRQLCEDDRQIDDEIFRIEQGLDAASDHDMTEMKLRRVHLKDQIAARLDDAGRAKAWQGAPGPFTS